MEEELKVGAEEAEGWSRRRSRRGTAIEGAVLGVGEGEPETFI